MFFLIFNLTLGSDFSAHWERTVRKLQSSSLVFVLLINAVKMPKCVLIIDDDEIFCGFLAEILKRRGLQVTWTTDALAGYSMALHDPYDLVIIDVRMPKVQGTELAENLRKEKPEAKIILISAFADEPLGRTAAHLGVALLSKPFSANRLYDVIAAAFHQPV